VATVNNYNAATNRINGASYDAAGNLTSFTGSSLTYDAENRITGASQSGVGSMYYFYDGAGRRVQEVSTYNVEKVFVYDAFGQMAAEYSLGAQSPPCTTCYIATDHLGSTRLVTDQNANVVARHDYLPFGEEIAANTGGRDGTFGTSDFVNQKFTGQERDVETGLDFFGARYFSAALGRFASPDTPLLDQDSSNPQSWNLYTYVRNNPLSFVDPDGHTCVTATGEPVAPDYPDVKWDNNDGYGCQTVVNVYGGYIDPISVILSLSRLVLLPAQDSTQLDRTSSAKTGILTSLKQKFCAAIPDARTVTADVGSGVGSVHSSVAATLDYKTRLTSFSLSGGFQVGWNGALSGQLSSGFVYGSSGTNRMVRWSGGAAVSPYYSRSGNSREYGLNVGVSLLGSAGGGRTVSVSTTSVGAVPGLEISPLEYILELAKQVCE
jgi:RHS repeat-associated protein